MSSLLPALFSAEGIKNDTNPALPRRQIKKNENFRHAKKTANGRQRSIRAGARLYIMRGYAGAARMHAPRLRARIALKKF